MLVPFHEVYAVRGQDGQPPTGLAQLSYIAFVSQARNQATGELGHLHWFTYTEDPAGVPGKYGDAALAGITRSQTVTKAHRGQTQVRESFSAVAEGGQGRLSLAYQQGGRGWAAADQPDQPVYAARDGARQSKSRRTAGRRSGRCWKPSTASCTACGTPSATMTAMPSPRHPITPRPQPLC